MGHPAVQAGIVEEAGEIDQGLAASGIFPIDQPKALAIVDEVIAMDIVMGKAGRHVGKSCSQALEQRTVATGGLLPTIGFRRQPLEVALEDGERASVARGSPIVFRQRPPDPVQQRQHLSKSGPIAQIGTAEGAPLDMTQDHQSGLGPDHIGPEPACSRGTRGGLLGRSVDVVRRIVAGNTSHEATVPRSNQKISIGQPARNWLDGDGTVPQGQGCEAFVVIELTRHDSFRHSASGSAIPSRRRQSACE